MRKDVNVDDKSVVQLSRVGRAAQLAVSDDRRSVTGYKGYRTVRGSHGVYQVRRRSAVAPTASMRAL